MQNEYNPDELIQYYIVNKDLGMSPGKKAGQVAHVCRRVTDWYKSDNSGVTEEHKNKYNSWIKDYNEKKIVLEAKQKTLEKLVAKGFFSVEDNGLTEIPPGSLTCVVLSIMTRKEAEPYTKRLQCLK